MAFEVFTKKGLGRRAEAPYVRIGKDFCAYVSTEAVALVGRDVELGWDAEHRRIGFKPVSEKTDNSYRAANPGVHTSAGTLSMRSFCGHYNIAPAGRLPLQQDGEWYYVQLPEEE